MQEPSSAVCMQHSILVVSCFSALMTLIGSLFGSSKWYCWITVCVTLVSTPLAISGAITLKRSVLVAYCCINVLELILKIIFAVNYARLKHERREECAPFITHSGDCSFWRMDDLNLTNAIVFNVFSSILQTVLLFFSIKLIRFLATAWIATSIVWDENSLSYDGRSKSFAYGTFTIKEYVPNLNTRRLTTSC